MKCEGRQHGMVRTYLILPSPYNPRPNMRILNTIDSPPTAGLFTKVPTRPTNHSKLKGKCSRAQYSECHLHPACKSKYKTKGNNKYKTKGNNKNKPYDASEHQIVVDGQPGLGLSGILASGLLVDLADYGYDTMSMRICAEDNENKGQNPADQDDYDHNGRDMDSYNVVYTLFGPRS